VVLNILSLMVAQGNIGSTRGGFPFLEDEDILENIVQIAEQSLILSIRG
jgi:rapamycin-insensitive companion of mTOR